MLVYISETRLKRVKHLRAWQENEKKRKSRIRPVARDVNRMPKPPAPYLYLYLGLGPGLRLERQKKKKNGRKIDEFNET